VHRKDDLWSCFNHVGWYRQPGDGWRWGFHRSAVHLSGPSDWGEHLVRNHEAICHWGGMSSGITVRMLDQSLRVVAKFRYLLGQ